MKTFDKPFTQQEPIPASAIARAVEVMESGRLHRYNTLAGETSEAALLEAEYARYQGVRYALATTSGGTAIQIALRVAGVMPGDKVLANAYTLAPVPGAIHGVGGEAVLVEIDANWHTDIADLEAKAVSSGARVFLLSHMRGHIANMHEITRVCQAHGITLIEDCAHTMGAKWDGMRSGNFGALAAFSTQTYKHLNSGEGGFLTTNDPDLAAQAVVHSGSYMLYSGHGAIPEPEVFERTKLYSPNLSSRIDNLRAAILRPQLADIESNVARFNERWEVLAAGFRAIPGLWVPQRDAREFYVGSSIQFQVQDIDDVPAFIHACAARGVELKWFGAKEPKAFTSRFDSWKYLGDPPDLPQTLKVLSNTCDMRVPLTFSLQDCKNIVEIVSDVLGLLNSA